VYFLDGSQTATTNSARLASRATLCQEHTTALGDWQKDRRFGILTDRVGDIRQLIRGQFLLEELLITLRQGHRILGTTAGQAPETYR